MSAVELPVLPPMPFDGDLHLLEVLWSRLSGALWCHGIRASLDAEAVSETSVSNAVRLSATEIRGLLAMIRHCAGARPHLAAKFATVLEPAG